MMSEIDDQKSCCEGGDCSPRDYGNKTIKTIAFAFIILLALGVTSYSLFFRDKEASLADCDPGAVAKPLEEITKIPALQERLSGADLALLVFTETDEILPVEISEMIDKSFSLIRDETSNSKIIILSPDDPDYEEAVDYYIITGFPSVMVLGRYAEKLLVGKGISEERILKAHDIVSNPPAPCCSIINSHIVLRS
jgi:hypothetical protein